MVLENERPNRKKLEEIFRNNDESEEAKPSALTPSKRFVAEEYERCKDPYYFYMNYWVTIDQYGNEIPPQPLTKEQWDERTKYYEEQRYKLRPRRPACDYPKVFPKGRHPNLQKEVLYVVPTEHV